MQFNYAYFGNTAVDNTATQTALSFAPDVKREPTFFTGELGHTVAFREAMGALHDVVVSDLRYKPRDKTEYKQFAEQREKEEWGQLLANISSQKQTVNEQITPLQKELSELLNRHSQRLDVFFKARRRYFDYLYERDKSAWFVLDPVITVHPDELFFECFSQDESSYGRLSVDYSVFQSVGEFQCGTTNVDYSDSLYQEFQKMRSYKTTNFTVDPSGFTVQTTNEESYQEVKIDLPDSWVRGFLQVNSAMTLPSIQFNLHPLDLHNFCFILRRHKEKQGPRSMRYLLTPNKPIEVLFEPFNLRVKCPRSIYHGTEATEVRVWGRRRLLILERLIPQAKQFTVHLLGDGLPSFYLADLGNMSFTLGLSGWTRNDWSRAGQFDLLSPRIEVDELTRHRVFQGLENQWFASPAQLAQSLNVSTATVLSALSAYSQAGRAMFDLNKQVYRRRELSREPLPLSTLRYANEREERAGKLLEENAVKLEDINPVEKQRVRIQATVKDKSKTRQPSLVLDGDERLVEAKCDCNWHKQNGITKGVCEHILAARLAWYRQKKGH